MRKNNNGFSVVELIIIIVFVGALGFVGFKVLKKDSGKQQASTTASSTSSTSGAKADNAKVSWSFDGSSWKASGTPPACSNPLTVNAPTDISKVASVLYPGQSRGGQYKPHGGFRFSDGQNENVKVTVPENSKLYKGSRYIEQGETQVLLIFTAPCGVMYRFDHLLTLSETYQKIVDENFPVAQPNDSRTTNLQKEIWANKGDVLATAVGFKKTGNASFDFGVYDLRSKNKISSDASWASKHADDKESAPYAVCWLDLLGSDSAKVKALPAGDAQSGKTSDYCTN